VTDTVQVQSIGQQLAATFVQAYGSAHFGGSLAFLPFGVSVPQDLIQPGPGGAPMVNVTAMQAWLAQNFDLPFIISADQGAVLQPDASHNATSQIYAQAASYAQPLGSADDPAWTRVDAEIAAAQRFLGPPGTPTMLACEPDDWAMPTSNAGYWTKFDSSNTQSTSTQTAVPTPIVHPEFWMVRSLALAPLASPAPVSPPPPPAAEAAAPAAHIPLRAIELSAVAHPALVNAEIARPMLATREVADVPTATPVSPALSNARVAAPSVLSRTNSLVLFKNYMPIETVTTTTSSSSSSTITVHLDHQYVSLGYLTAGQPWWNQTFLSDPSWYVPGMKAAGILPAAAGASDAQYSRPIGLIVVQNLKVSGQWSAEAAAALNAAGATIGPLSLVGAVSTTASDGLTVTYERDGMQVVALLCTPLPILPPADDPKLDPPTTDSLIGLGLGLAENLLGGGSGKPQGSTPAGSSPSPAAPGATDPSATPSSPPAS
jgi:hypothetical protein